MGSSSTALTDGLEDGELGAVVSQHRRVHARVVPLRCVGVADQGAGAVVLPRRRVLVLRGVLLLGLLGVGLLRLFLCFWCAAAVALGGGPPSFGPSTAWPSTELAVVAD